MNKKKMIIRVIIAILMFLTVPAEAQHVLTKENTMMRPGDAISKQMTAFAAPGESGEDAVWDIRNIKVREKAYRVEYAGDSIHSLLAVHPRYMNIYKMVGDTLIKTGYENPNVNIVYQHAVPELVFPFAYGDTVSARFEGKGLYCRHNGIVECGTALVEADGTGTLLLSDEDTLHQVLRVHSIRTSSVAMDRDSLVADSATRLFRIEDGYKWFARGYRYPVFETLTETYYRGTQYVCSHKAAYRTMPDSIRSLDDAVNEDIIRSDSVNNAHHDTDIIQYQVSYYGNIVKVDYSLSMRASVAALVSDPMGIVYMRYQHTDDAGDGYSFSFDLNGLRKGEYILYLNANGNISSQTIYKKE